MWLSQKSTADSSLQLELLAEQDTTISLWTLLAPLATPLTETSIVTEDSTGRRFRVVGEVASRPDHRPRWKAASLRLISDMQGAPA